MRKIVSFFLLSIFFGSCISKNKASVSFKGNYRYVDNKQIVKIVILDNNKITVEKMVEANKVKCIGGYKFISNKKIKINCEDERGGHKSNSIDDLIPLRFNIKNELIYLESNTIKYENLKLTKE